MSSSARGNGNEVETNEQFEVAMAPAAAFRGAGMAASASMVNRTHRVVHERAKSMQARRTRFRSLWIPLTVSGGLLAVVVCAIWTVLDEYEMTPTGLPDANQQMLVLMMWCLPVSALLLCIVWFNRGFGKADNGRAG